DFTLNFPYVDEEITMAIKKDKKGEYISKLFDSKPISPNNEKTPNQVQIVFSTTPVASKTLSTSTNQTTTTRTSEVTTGEGTINSQNVDTVSASGTDVGIKDRETTGTNLTFVSTTSTTTTLTTTNASKTIEPDGKVYVEGYTGTIGCPKPMTDENFNLMKLNISENNLEATKLSIAKQVLQENCLLAGQVRELLSLFEFENTKLDFAKFAYTYTYDPGNYYKVNEAFEFESSVDDLNKHINPK
ncbi:MAG: DUF4476 domain-containing protein, partial [Bacteroidia bacterium]|nr:DUF4476 domain-containing protein [Bacteroidia bacterium]